jgi:hypothetical protein
LTLLPSCPTIDTHGLVDVNYMLGIWNYAAYRSGIRLTCVKTGIIIARHVPCATHRIIDVIAEPGRIWRIIATAEAKLAGSDEILPCEKSIGMLSRGR